MVEPQTRDPLALPVYRLDLKTCPLALPVH